MQAHRLLWRVVSELLCFRSIPCPGQMDYGNSTPCCWKGICINAVLKFNCHDPTFCLMSQAPNHNYQIHIDKAVLMICHKRIGASVRESHESALLKSPSKYPVKTSKVKFFTKAQGSADLSEPNLHTGILPRRVVLGLVSSAAFNGNYSTNPLNFAPYNLSSIQLRRNGIALPFERLDMNFETEQILPGYMSLFHGIG